MITVLDNSIRAKVAERYQGVLDARAAEAANKTIETSRERVEAELMFEKYVLDISIAIDAEAAHEARCTSRGLPKRATDLPGRSPWRSAGAPRRACHRWVAGWTR